jgi:hypothetical protein
MHRLEHVRKNLVVLSILLILGKPYLINAQNKTERVDLIQSNSKTTIDGTYELIERVMNDGTVLRAPAIKGLYMLFHGRLNFNLFIKKKDGTMSSESTIGHYTITKNQYCEWIDYTIRNNLDSAGATYNGPVVTNRCANVIWNKDGFSYAPPGESVDVIFRSDGFTAKITGEFVDHWKRVR